MSILLIFYLISLLENDFIIYFLIRNYTKCDVISKQNRKLKLKSFINETLDAVWLLLLLLLLLQLLLVNAVAVILIVLV